MLLTSFKIRNFKFCESLDLENLKKINIFIGKPNTGKTSILEALSLFLAKNPQMLISILDERSMIGDDACFESLFFDCVPDKTIDLKSNTDLLSISPNFQRKRLVVSESNSSDIGFSYMVNDLVFSFNKKPYSNITFSQINENKIEYSVSVIENNYENLMNVLWDVEFIAGLRNREYFKKFLNNLSKILTDTNKAQELQKNVGKFTINIEDLKFVAGNKILIQQKQLKHAMDFRLLGQGFQFYIFVLVAILSGKKYILIDEIENGLHFESIDLLLESILNSPKDAQFFITTHNKEILQRLASKIGEKNKKTDSIAIFNIYHNKKQKLEAVQYSQENFIHAMSYGNEIRE